MIKFPFLKKELNVVLKNGSIGLFFQIIPFVLLLFTVPKYFEILGEKKWAITSVCFSIILIIQFIDFGISKSTNKIISQKSIFDSNLETRKYIANGFFLIILSSLVIWFAINSFDDYLISIIFKGQELWEFKKTVFKSSILSGVVLSNINYFRNIYESRQSFYLTSSLRAITMSIIYFPIIGTFIFGTQILNLIELLPIFYLIILIVYLLITIKKFHFLNSRFIEFEIAKKITQSGFILFLIGIFILINNQIDIFILSRYVDLSEAVYYFTCKDLFSKLNTISGSVALSLMPMVSYISSTSLKEAKKLYFGISKFVLPFLVFAFFLYVFLGDFFLEIWIDKNFSQKSFSISIIFVAAYFINFFSILLLNSLIGIGSFNSILIVEILIFIMKTLAMYFMIKSFFLNGAAISLLIMEVFHFILLLRVFKNNNE